VGQVDVTAGPPLLDVRGLSKDFPGQRALDRVDLRVDRGEILGLAGANGSGKSTLIKVLAGYHQPDEGEIDAFGQPVWPEAHSAHWRNRCHFIHQDLGLIPTLSAAENLALGSGYQRAALGRISWRRQRQRAREAIGRFGADFDVDLPVSELTPAERTMVAIARALDGWQDADALLVLDEPTASLHGDEVAKLFAATRGVAARGAGVIFVSHRIDEMLSLADRVAVLRDGRLAGVRAARGLGADELVELIAGRPVDDLYTDPPAPREDVVLSARELSGARVSSISFELHRGEVLGVTGLMGSGREELPGLLFGSTARTGGTISIDGEPLPAGSTRASMRRGLAMVPADRARSAAVMTQSVRENVLLADLLSAWRRVRIDPRRERAEVADWMARLDIRPRDQDQPLAQLSGGNQQKAVLAKWFRTDPRIIVLDEPTQGVDVGAKAAIYRHLAAAAEAGAALVVCSSEAKDLAAICDRVLVLRDGAIAAVLHDRSLTEQRIVSESVAVSRPSGPAAGEEGSEHVIERG
jgi:ABC-type sugar transport system ATPase subunit